MKFSDRTLETKTFKIPILGFGVYRVGKNEILDAINVGYRHIDTAQYYKNEEQVGQAIKVSGIDRKEFFITTKVVTEGYDNTLKGIDISLQKLGYDYYDLILIHRPLGDDISIYKAMETAYKQGKCKAIGLSNFNEEHFLEIYNNCEIKPVINQIETHVMWQQWKMHKFLKKYDCIHESRSPLGQGNFGLFENEILIKIAQKYKKTIAQIMLRFFIQNNVVVIPRTSHIERMKENSEVFDFILEDNDIDVIKGLDKKISYGNRPESMGKEQNY